MIRYAAGLALGALLFGAGVVEARRATRPDERAVPGEAVETVKKLLVLLRHYEQSGGDSRFLERLPVTPALASEISDARAWSDHLDERVESDPVRAEVRGARWDREGVVIVRTREYAVARIRSRSAGPAEPGTTRAAIGDWEYHVVRAFGDWRVADWSAVADREEARER